MVKFIAEFTTNHMGNLNLLLKMVDAASKINCDYIKMQKKDVYKFYTKDKLNMHYDSPYGKTYGEYRETFEFDKKQFDIFDEKCKEKKIKWFATFQDIESLQFLLEYNLDMYKIASANARNYKLLEKTSKLIDNDRTIIISLAGNTLKQIEKTLSCFPKHNLIVNHCVAEYPCDFTNLRLGNIHVLKEKFENSRVKVGYSGHEKGIEPSLAALDMDIEYLERHFCLSRTSFVHHIDCSLTPDEYKKIINLYKRNDNLNKYYQTLPEEAFTSKFGMTHMEKSFLVKNTYGEDYINERSNIK